MEKEPTRLAHRDEEEASADWRKGKYNGQRWFGLQEPYQELVQRWAEASAEDPSVTSKFSPSKVAREMDVKREGMQPKPSLCSLLKKW